MKKQLLAGFLILLGGIWVLQGAGWLEGSFMTGDRFWLFAGTLLIMLGTGLLFFQKRKPSDDGEN